MTDDARTDLPVRGAASPGARARRRARGDGDGWVRCDLGHRHWGRFGAAGVLVGARGRSLLQLRAPWTHHGGVWGVPGGARDSSEGVVEAALREAREEADLSSEWVEPLGWIDDDHGGWSYTTVIATIAEHLLLPTTSRPGRTDVQAVALPPVRPLDGESLEVRWWDDGEIPALDLHPGVRAVWPRSRPVPGALHIVVDAANVIGSTPNGWWRDRAGAAARLLADLTDLASRGIGEPVAANDPPTSLSGRYPRFVVVVEGAFRSAPWPVPGSGSDWPARRLRRVDAVGSGDDAIVDAVAALATAAGTAGRTCDPRAAGRTIVVTADRALRERVVQADPNASTVGPGWLLAR